MPLCADVVLWHSELLGGADAFPHLFRSSKFRAGSRVRVPVGTKAAYMSRGMPVSPEGGVPVPRAAYVSNMNTGELQKELRQRGLGTDGRWNDLVARLKESRQKGERLPDANLRGSDPMDHEGAEAGVGPLPFQAYPAP